jgi:hypothetical protein
VSTTLEKIMSTRNKARDRGLNGKLLRKYCRTYGPHFPQGTPKWWRKLFMTRPRRRANKDACRFVIGGCDQDGHIFPLGNCKPHQYYW